MDFNEILKNADEKEVAKIVLNELKTYGDNSKKNYEELRKNVEEVKHTVDDMSKDTLAVSKFQKLGEDITIRQQALDEKIAKQEKEATDRMDAIEVALKRPGKGTGADDERLVKEALDFQIAKESIMRKSDNGISFEEKERISEKADVASYKAYTKAFEAYVRKYGGSRDMIMNPDLVKALQVGVGPDGGITVPIAMSNRITQILYESDPIRQLASVESITTGRLEWMAEWDQAGAGWEGETASETVAGSETSTPGWRKRAINVHMLYAKPKATQTLLEDSGINIENWLANKIADRFARLEGAAFVSGDGVGKPRGFLTYEDDDDFGKVEQIHMGAAAALTADGFYDVKFHLKEQYLERGTWLMNRSTVLAALKLKDGQGNYIWSNGLIENRYSTILGLPVRMSTSMPAVAANALSVVLADWKAAYLIVDRLGITVQRDPYTVVPFVMYYTRKRVGGDVDNWEAIKIGTIEA